MMQRNPGRKFANFHRFGQDAWSPRGGRASLQGALSPTGAQRPLPSLETGYRLQLVGARPGRDSCPWRGLDFRSRRSSLRVLQSPRLHSRAASRLRPLCAGTLTSSGLPPQMTAGARAALHPGGSQYRATEPAFEPASPSTA